MPSSAGFSGIMAGGGASSTACPSNASCHANGFLHGCHSHAWTTADTSESLRTHQGEVWLETSQEHQAVQQAAHLITGATPELLTYTAQLRMSGTRPLARSWCRYSDRQAAESGRNPRGISFHDACGVDPSSRSPAATGSTLQAGVAQTRRQIRDHRFRRDTGACWHISNLTRLLPAGLWNNRTRMTTFRPDSSRPGINAVLLVAWLLPILSLPPRC